MILDEALPSITPLVFVVVGTDHHPFDRLCRWIDGWYDAHQADARCLIQAGTAAPPRHTPWVASLRHDEVQETMRRSAAVVCHAGPATVMDCRAAGLRPIVVPRRRDLGEHVDDHQLHFARRFAEAGLVRLAESEDALIGHLTDALEHPASFCVDGACAVSPGVQRFGEVVSLLAKPRPRLRRILVR